MMTALDEYIKKDLSKPGFTNNPPLKEVFQISQLNNLSKNNLLAMKLQKKRASPRHKREVS